MSIIITFDLSKIKSDDWYKKIKSNLTFVRNSFIKCFFLFSVVYFLGTHCLEKQEINLSIIKLNNSFIQFITCLSFIVLILCMGMFILNFINLQKLKDDIEKRLRYSS